MLNIPETTLKVECHPCHDEITRELDEYFLAHWPFTSDNARKKFLKSKINLYTCLALPHGDEKRVKLACELVTLNFLVDDYLDSLSYTDGGALVRKLTAIASGRLAPNHADPIEHMHYVLWQRVLTEDQALGEAICECHCELMQAQCAPKRAEHASLAAYLDFREIDGGMKALGVVHCFVADVHLSRLQKEILAPIERTVASHICVLNDVISWEKELKDSENGAEGSSICSSVVVLAGELGVDVEGARSMLSLAVRGYERVFRRQYGELTDWCNTRGDGKAKQDILRILGDLEYRMSGIEKWSQLTGRYKV